MEVVPQGDTPSVFTRRRTHCWRFRKRQANEGAPERVLFIMLICLTLSLRRTFFYFLSVFLKADMIENSKLARAIDILKVKIQLRTWGLNF
jgi:hypothetical protein